MLKVQLILIRDLDQTAMLAIQHVLHAQIQEIIVKIIINILIYKFLNFL